MKTKILISLQRRAINFSYRMRLKERNFTLISQNCIGGVIYNLLGVPFQSPTINMFIEGDNFIKLVDNLDYYMTLTPTAVMDCFIDPLDSNIRYPKIACGDVEICAMHYQNCDEAIEAWERRRKRVNLDNVYVIGNSWNCHENPKLVSWIANCKYPSVVFTYGEYKEKNCINLDGDFWHLDSRGVVRPNITDHIEGGARMYFENMFDFVGWLNKKYN